MKTSQASPTAVDPASGGELRQRLHAMWSAVAPAWGANAEFVEARGRRVDAELIERCDLHRGERLLELACGTGGTGIAAVPFLGDEGEVVLSDVSTEMTALAADRASGLGTANVRACRLDLEEIEEPDASFDAVLCREGLMLVPDPRRAAREIIRVLRPGGRLALSVWGPRKQNPWLGLVFDAVGEQLGKQLPPPGLPHPFSLENEEQLVEVLVSAGFEKVRVTQLSTPYRAGSADEWWKRTSALAGPLSKMLAALPESTSKALEDRAVASVEPFRTGAGIEIPGVSLIASGRRP